MPPGTPTIRRYRVARPVDHGTIVRILVVMTGSDDALRSRRPRDGAWDPARLRVRETLIDRQIREAQEAGAFDDLPFHGERIPLDDDTAAGEWALAHHVLKNARMVPPWIATDQEVRTLLARRDAILERAPRSATAIARQRDRRQLEEVVAAANRAITILNNEAPTDRQHRRPLRLELELAALAVAHGPDARDR
jgi:hypothetical protein